MPNKIRAVIFDVGGVLAGFKRTIDLPEGRFSAKLKIGWQSKKLRKMIKGLELGKFSEEQFFREANKTAKKSYSLEQFRDCWCDMFRFRNWVVPLVSALRKAGYKIGVVSNISPWHFEKISGHYGLGKIVDAFSVSCKIRARKPDKRIFGFVLKRLKEKAENCVYIDDLQKYVDAANSLGFNAVRYKSYARLKKDLKKFNVLRN